ncbi:LysR family transcriptional regulator [Aminobacter sp. MSH1]|uniref:LysR family transcriptional regulator n=1 Tax=Aminobacter sp. MSH1 TaxID=374606 RepID=UPI000D33DF70|nr:LysR family transcriptional regulator [Aminobacter sp. MSH1]
MHYDFVDLRLLVAIIDAGGFNAAARQANLSVSALSERIRRLEAEAGVALFQRGARGSKPTRPGLEIAAHARAILLQGERLTGAVAAWKQSQSGRMRLLANSSAISGVLPDILATFLARHPGVAVNLEEETSDEIGYRIRSGQADLGIAAVSAKLEGLALKPFRTDRLALLVPAAHALSSRRSVGFADLLEEHFIGLDEHSAIHAYLGQQARKLGGELIVRIRLRSFESVCRMVVAGAGAAILPLGSILPGTLEAGARIVALTDDWAERQLVICLPVDRAPPPLVDMLVAALAPQPLRAPRGLKPERGES